MRESDRAAQFATAVDMCRPLQIDPKRFRAALRSAGLTWHSHNGRWEVRIGSPEHDDMLRVLATLAKPAAKTARETKPARPVSASRSRTESDEAWVIDLCDSVLGMKARRQHRFSFLVGDPGISGRRAALPVDAFYPELGVVIEYRERQHSEAVALFDKRRTVSGMSRGEQRRRYDNLRRTLIPEHGYRLVELDFSEFGHTSGGRLKRDDRARETILERLQDHLRRL